ncbi:Archaic translocase outer mitochondrial membrane 40 [Trypanosoma equiperdum]|uniref:Archaic translocase outer mitochondrial membrane 40 n=4 Tax=Trypanozoon TaxID=39700 RepID=Q38E31_TRYB2|nr:hypothetical protein, conserved [Trypanosoma brucei gambiense DAL972]XP_827269.1 hypothetical protein, conserved [Trypanosoma brucei brucei TREU927]RHW70319.1 Archaic translocase outer mitochondrial membrane 40 [Trypanosoma brucei equiperdum]SCU72477.1 Archaic translocase outer mitochondrial membrane 40 [Trypanosoma equiperdum]EAN76939.1 hypothetical protein, conserved [Trypanosoma brucei brucei TREU927]CBH14476.1 hypothetical protein, conserved [Trypanosoma brucei gambiense DAL972]|eukprot:XP_011776742.1 hypothetical protein, conserved [Trypanosoma brucei gambiense DAL972]
MLKEWLRGKQSEEPVAQAEPVKRGALGVDVESSLEPSQEEIIAQREDAFRRKLAASAKEGPPSPGKVVAYDTLLRPLQRLLLDGNAAETQEGLTISVARNAQNVMMSTKTMLVSPQMSNWELSLQMNGFSDIVVATYNTLSRWSLMYQRVSSTGALLFAQCMAQRQQGMTQGTVVGMIQYPWVQGGCTQVQYVKDQSFSVSHAQRLIRGFYLGSNLSWDALTKGTSLSYAGCITNPSKTGSLAAEWSPSKGEWKVGLTRSDWASDVEFAMQLEYTKKGQSGLMGLLSFGTKKQFVGGGSVSTAMLGFSQLKAVVEVPFGGDRSGFNQFMCMYNALYDIHSGGLKHGVVFTA